MFGIFSSIKSWFVATDKDNDGRVSDDIAKEVVEDVKEVVAVVKKTKKELEALTKKELEEFGRELGIELDRRLLKAKLVAQLVSAQRKKKGE